MPRAASDPAAGQRPGDETGQQPGPDMPDHRNREGEHARDDPDEEADGNRFPIGHTPRSTDGVIPLTAAIRRARPAVNRAAVSPGSPTV